MAAQQTVLFTVLPRAITLNAATLPVSVLVSPRLMGGTRLGAFPDWVSWTALLKKAGLTLIFRNGTKQTEVRIDTKVLRPELWKALFNEKTLVRSRQFDDYSGHGIISYSMRESLSALKAVYQVAGVVLALPDAISGGDDRQDNRYLLKGLTEGFDVHWNGDMAKRWRHVVRNRYRETKTPVPRGVQGPLDGEGLFIYKPQPTSSQSVAVPFSVFHHMPTPDPKTAGEVQFDPDSVDFHQAIGSLESHPELLRALGLVFDLELPADFLTQTPANGYDRVAVAKTNFAWKAPTQSPPLDTAYQYLSLGTDRVFLTASRALSADPGPAQVVGLLNLAPEHFGLAQVDVDGGLHKLIQTAEIWNDPDPDRNRNSDVTPEDAPHPEVYDPDATLPSLRSGGMQLYADQRGLHVLDAIRESKDFNSALESGGAQPRPFFAEDLVRGYRLDVWDSASQSWQSLHRRKGDYRIGDERLPFATEAEEGFQQLATTQPAPGAQPAEKDLYVHEAIARWAGWSLSVAMPGKSLSRFGDPAKAIPPDGDDPDYRTDEAVTPYKIRADYKALPKSLPRLRFGLRYRMRARAVDLAGNSLRHDDPIAAALAIGMALPRDPEGLTYLRYEPVISPLVVIRDEQALTSPGSAVDRLVIRSFNSDPSLDGIAADTTAGDRHILPPRSSVDMLERHGLLDDAAGKLKTDAATWKLAGERDAAELPQTAINVAGKTDNYPIATAPSIDELPYLPDPLSRGAAFRDLPGATAPAVANASPGAGGGAALDYALLSDPNPRPGSATIIHFNAGTDWAKTTGFRFVLDEPQPGQTDLRPQWDAAARVLTVFLRKGQTAVTPLSSFLTPDDLKLMGQWQWLREFIERITIFDAQPEHLLPGFPVDLIAHVLQRSVEGGHWLISPPRLLTLIHAVQQPLGRPQFVALNVDHEDQAWDKNPLQTDRVRGRADPQELTAITAWRRPGATDAYLMGAIKIHGASSAKLDLAAEWSDPVDDPAQPAPDTHRFKTHVEELPLARPLEGYLRATGKAFRNVGYYDPENDQIAMVRTGDKTAKSATWEITFSDAAPRHLFNDTKRHRVSYTASASSRYREYFPQDQALDFTRTSDPVLVDVPASARPLAPEVLYVIPTFGWQRQVATNMKRSVRFGGGLRVYLNRPWYSSGEGELLGVTLWSSANGSFNDSARDKFKSYITQWGMDPIWNTADLMGVPGIYDFPDRVASDSEVALEEANAALAPDKPGRVDVVGYTPQFDPDRRLWYADLTVDTGSTYAPFVRLALVRYQPHALDEARISRVVVAGFAQLTPDRAALVTADPHHPRTLRIVISGTAPRSTPVLGGAALAPAVRPTHVVVRVQRRGAINSDLSWEDVPAAEATVTQFYEGQGLNQPDLALWVGAVTFAQTPPAHTYRLLVEEFEYIAANDRDGENRPGRLIYAETFEVDTAFVTA
jgi:hypothetical protein